MVMAAKDYANIRFGGLKDIITGVHRSPFTVHRLPFTETANDKRQTANPS